jgi:TonB family protein
MADKAKSKDATSAAAAAPEEPRAPAPAATGPFAGRATGLKSLLGKMNTPSATPESAPEVPADSSGDSAAGTSSGAAVVAAAIATLTSPRKVPPAKPVAAKDNAKPIEKVAAPVAAESKQVETAAIAQKSEPASEPASKPAGDTPPSLPPATEKSEAAPPASTTPATTPAIEGSVFGVLDAEQRIRRSAEQNERTLWTGAVLATLIYTALIAGQAITGIAALVSPEQMQKERMGQDAPPSISVEIVADPDRNAKTPHAHDGAMAPGPQPTDQPPQPPQTASVEQPDTPEKEPTKDPAEKRPDGTPMMLDIDSLVDAAAADLKNKIDKAFAKKPQQRQREQQASGGDIQMRGTGASGKSNPFSRSVIAALLKTRPGPFALWGRVLVSFQLNEAGELNYVHMLQSSGNAALDEAAVEAIHKARFERPPAGLSPDDRTYIIDYIFG